MRFRLRLWSLALTALVGGLLAGCGGTTNHASDTAFVNRLAGDYGAVERLITNGTTTDGLPPTAGSLAQKISELAGDPGDAAALQYFAELQVRAALTSPTVEAAAQSLGFIADCLTIGSARHAPSDELDVDFRYLEGLPVPLDPARTSIEVIDHALASVGRRQVKRGSGRVARANASSDEYGDVGFLVNALPGEVTPGVEAGSSKADASLHATPGHPR